MPGLIDDPTLLSQILRELRVKGSVDPFVISDTAIAVFDIGRLTGLPVQEVVTPGQSLSVRIGLPGVESTVPIALPAANPADVNDDTTVAPAAGTVLADTGALAQDARYWCQIVASHDDGVAIHYELQWRNAANTATLATWPFWTPTNFRKWITFNTTAVSERLRLVNVTAIAGTSLSVITAVVTFPATAA